MVVLCQRFGVSERRACCVVGQHRSTQRKPARPRPELEDKLRARLRQIARDHPRWGWKTAHALVRREGFVVNRKRTQRLWRDEGLRRPAPCKRKRRRPPPGQALLRARRPNHVWAIDFQFDEAADQRRLKLLNVVLVKDDQTLPSDGLVLMRQQPGRMEESNWSHTEKISEGRFRSEGRVDLPKTKFIRRR